ncbi:MAG: hypothetical protein R3B49_03625 [Phycisphaerales bacterium]
MSAVQVGLMVVGAYAAVGVVFAIAFVLVGVKRVDPVAAHAPVRVRVLFLPGAAALWPMMLAKWRASARGAST